MTREYHLIRYIPDPVRGEMVNVALVALVDGQALVMALSANEIVKRAARIAPHVDASNGVAFAAELAASSKNASAVVQLLDVFDPHFRVEEGRRLSSTVDVEATLATAFRDLIAEPAKRRRVDPRKKWTLERALTAVGDRAPTFGAHARRKVSVREQPEVFGFDNSLFESTQAPNFPAFDAVVPNCVRVLALRGLIVGEKMQASTFFETRADLDAASDFFDGRVSSKTVMTGALLLPHAKEQVSLATRDGMREGLAEVVSTIQVEGLRERTAVFDLSNPADERYLEELSAILARTES